MSLRLFIQWYDANGVYDGPEVRHREGAASHIRGHDGMMMQLQKLQVAVNEKSKQVEKVASRVDEGSQ